MSSQPPNPPAFPDVETDLTSDFNSSKDYPRTYSYGGMSLRDYFAGQALASLAAPVSDMGRFTDQAVAERIADFCGRIADAMLAEREK